MVWLAHSRRATRPLLRAPLRWQVGGGGAVVMLRGMCGWRAHAGQRGRCCMRRCVGWWGGVCCGDAARNVHLVRPRRATRSLLRAPLRWQVGVEGMLKWAGSALKVQEQVAAAVRACLMRQDGGVVVRGMSKRVYGGLSL